MSDHKDNNGGQPSPKRSQCRDVFLFSHPRTASNLLSRLLSDQPGWVQTEYHFQSTFMFAEKAMNLAPITAFTDEQRTVYGEMLKQGMEALDQAVNDATTNDYPLFIKNHVVQIWEPSRLSQSIWGDALPPPFPFPGSTTDDDTTLTARTNPTILSDAFLNSIQPVFIVRHPALAFESWYRTESGSGTGTVDISDRSWGFYMSYTYSRQLYDWFASQAAEASDGDAAPLILVDADDIINETSITKLCQLCGMDPSLVRTQWDVTAPKDGEDVTQRHLSYMGGLWNSTSIDKSKTSEAVDLDDKHQKWVTEFGQVVADELWKRSEEAMEDYLYLKSKRL